MTDSESAIFWAALIAASVVGLIAGPVQLKLKRLSYLLLGLSTLLAAAAAVYGVTAVLS